MRRTVTIFVILLAVTLAARESVCQSAPRKLAGFVLGDLLDHHRGRLREGTVLSTRFFESLKEVETIPLFGYKSSLVYYGTCRQPERIIRLKFKYADSSKEFYNELLERFTIRFGEADKWRGDPFGIVLAWKWSFFDQKGNDISLILQHNLKDEEEKKGNVVKLTAWNLMQAESRCFESKTEQPPGDDKERRFDFREGRKIDWDWFVPE